MKSCSSTNLGRLSTFIVEYHSLNRKKSLRLTGMMPFIGLRRRYFLRTETTFPNFWLVLDRAKRLSSRCWVDKHLVVERPEQFSIKFQKFLKHFVHSEWTVLDSTWWLFNSLFHERRMGFIVPILAFVVLDLVVIFNVFVDILQAIFSMLVHRAEGQRVRLFSLALGLVVKEECNSIVVSSRESALFITVFVVLFIKLYRHRQSSVVSAVWFTQSFGKRVV